MRSIKIAVIAMGVLIVVGVIVLVVGLMNRLGGSVATTPVASRVAAGAVPFFTLPRGSTIEEMQASGTQVTLRLRLDERRQRLMVIDLGTGALLGTVDLAAD